MWTAECALAWGEVSVGCTLLEQVTLIFLTPAGAPKLSHLHSVLLEECETSERSPARQQPH